MSRTGRFLAVWLGTAFILFYSVSNAVAHRVNVFAYREGDVVNVEGYFVDGTPAAGSKVEVFDAAGRLVARGKTDREGLWSFSTKEKGQLRIELVASMGHKGTFVLEREDSEGKAPGSTGAEREIAKGVETSVAQKESKINKGVLEEIVVSAVKKEIRPVMSTLLEMKREMDKPSLNEVVGGLGYIVGIAGILFFIKGRRGK